MQEIRTDGLILGELAKGTLYAKSNHDLARRLIGDPARQTLLTDTLVVLDGLVATGLVDKKQEPDLLNIDQRFGTGPMVWAYSLTDAGRKAAGERMSHSQG